MDPLIPKQCAVKHIFLSDRSADILKAEPLTLSMLSHEFLAILVVGTLRCWGTSF